MTPLAQADALSPVPTDPDPDAALLAAIARGDRQAFDRFYRRHERRCLGFARQLLRDESTAEDVVVEAMLGVWQQADRYTGRSRVSTWLLGIVRHKALDALRRRSRERSHEPVEALDAVPDPGRGPSESMTLEESLRDLHTALGRLTPEHREALTLAFVEELPYEEIAEMLAIPVNTVKTRVFHARQRLRQALADAAYVGSGP